MMIITSVLAVAAAPAAEMTTRIPIGDDGGAARFFPLLLRLLLIHVVVIEGFVYSTHFVLSLYA